MEIVTGILYNVLIAGFLLALVATPFVCSLCFACKLDKSRKNNMQA